MHDMHEILSENTGLWQLPKASDASRFMYNNNNNVKVLDSTCIYQQGTQGA